MNGTSLLAGLFCLLVAVTVIGHGIWVLVAKILGAGSESVPPTPAPASRGRRACPRCGLTFDGERCAACDWPTARELAHRRPEAALDALDLQIKTLERLRVLDAEVCESLSRTVDEQRQRLAPAAASIESPVVPDVKRFGAEPIVAGTVEVPPVPPVPGARIARAPIAHAPRALVEPSAQAPPSPVAPAMSVAERASQFRERRPPSREASAAAVPLPPERSWTDWLAAFMEERNMRWGELVGGLLIVCCSIALVISFWSAIAERPWLKFIVFNGVTAGLFGVGFYSEKRWRLQTTSQGLLMIGAMLVPLNFLAIAAFSSAPDSGQVLVIARRDRIGGAVRTWSIAPARSSSNATAPWLTAGVLIPSLAQLLVRRFVDPDCQPGDAGRRRRRAGGRVSGRQCLAHWPVRAQSRVFGEARRQCAFQVRRADQFRCRAVPWRWWRSRARRRLRRLRRLPLVPSACATGALGHWACCCGRNWPAAA